MTFLMCDPRPRIRARVTISLCVLPCIPAVLSAQARVATAIEWRPVDNPHVITQDLLVTTGQLLHVYPGAVVQLDPDVNILIRGGRLQAIGTVDSLIVFTRHIPTGRWGAIVLEDSDDNKVIRTRIEGGDVYQFGGMLHCVRSQVDIDECEFGHFVNDAFQAREESRFTLANSAFHDGLRRAIGVNSGAQGTIQGCTFDRIGLTFTRDAIELTGDPVLLTSATVADCIFRDIGDDGIDLDFEFQGILYGNRLEACGNKGISVATESRATIFNTTVLRSEVGVGVSASAVAEIANCTFFDCLIGLEVVKKWSGYGGGMAIVKNLVAWNTDSVSVFVDGVSTLSATYSDFEDLVPGEGNISVDPRFVDPAGDDFHLLAFSPCIDAGTSDLPAPPSDFEGDARFNDPNVGDTGGGTITYVDMGIDERRDASVDVPEIAGEPPPRVRIFPNPVPMGTGTHLWAPQGAREVSIYDVAGRRLRTLRFQAERSGHLVAWDGRDHRGVKAPPGVYTLQLTGNDWTVSRAVTIY